MKNIIKLLAVSCLFVSCEDMFTPQIENNLDIDHIYNNASYAQGLLANGYTRIPIDGWSFNDVATDDAVSNDNNNGYRKMASGTWAADRNPMDRWTSCRSAIHYLNLFLSETDKVNWAADELVAGMFNDRMKGEAYGLRGMYMYYLLQAHGGWTEDGRLLGIPLLTEAETTESDFNQPRATFDECMKQVYADLDKAIELLPVDYADIARDADVPAKYKNKGVTAAQYTRVFGDLVRLRMTGRIAEGVRAQAALLAASPAFASGSTTTWTDAAQYAATVLDRIGGIGGLDNSGNTWYANSNEIESLKAGENPAEILWRTGSESSSSLESDHFPPTLYGKGRLNPSQNLVDAFPMANGYPISLDNSQYDAANPYANRDPRLSLYILFDGGTAGPNNTTIYTAADGSTNDALNKTETSTRSGYYMKKLMRQDVNLNPSSVNNQKHYKARMRYTEIFLSYAEAANEAYGPTANGGSGYSAYDVVKAIRQRAGVGVDNGDAYLESIKNDKEAMRILIRNERRLELCFEGFRFWDLRRWNTNLNETVRGMSIASGNYNPALEVETRSYKEYMNFGPIPYSEVLKFDALVQNKGWR